MCGEETAASSQNMNDGNDVAWMASGGSGTVILDRQEVAQTLETSDFGFSLPPGKTVVGITATLNIASPDNESNGIEAGLVAVISGSKSGSRPLFPSGDNLWPTGATDQVVGGDDDTWDEDWTTDDFNSSALKVNLLNVEQSLNNNEHTGTVNSVKLKVCYVV